MPENARPSDAGLFDQFEDEHRIADWGGDELFTRMPRPRPVDDAPAPRFQRSPEPAPARRLTLVEPAEQPDEPVAGRRWQRSGEEAMRERAERLGLSVVESPDRAGGSGRFERTQPADRAGGSGRFERTQPADRDDEPSHRFDETGAMLEPEPAARPTKIITGRPGEAPRPLPVVRSERRRPSRTPAEWVGPRPERIVGWAFALGLLLILIAITTADAATL
jgi:hypothetical protein